METNRILRASSHKTKLSIHISIVRIKLSSWFPFLFIITLDLGYYWQLSNNDCNLVEMSYLIHLIHLIWHLQIYTCTGMIFPEFPHWKSFYIVEGVLKCSLRDFLLRKLKSSGMFYLFQRFFYSLHINYKMKEFCFSILYKNTNLLSNIIRCWESS